MSAERRHVTSVDEIQDGGILLGGTGRHVIRVLGATAEEPRRRSARLMELGRDGRPEELERYLSGKLVGAQEDPSAQPFHPRIPALVLLEGGEARFLERDWSGVAVPAEEGEAIPQAPPAGVGEEAGAEPEPAPEPRDDEPPSTAEAEPAPSTGETGVEAGPTAVPAVEPAAQPEPTPAVEPTAQPEPIPAAQPTPAPAAVPTTRVAGAATAEPVVDRVVAVASPLVGTPAGATFWDHIRNQFSKPQRTARVQPRSSDPLAPLIQELYSATTATELRALDAGARATALSEIFTRLTPAAAPAGPGGTAPTLAEEITVELTLIGDLIRDQSQGGWRAVREGVLASFGVFEIGAAAAIQRANGFYAQLVPAVLFGSPRGSLVHPQMQAALDRASARLVNAPAAVRPAIVASVGTPGGFYIRPNANAPSVLSLHSFGFAVDLTPTLNPNIGPNSATLAPVAPLTGRPDPTLAETEGLTADQATRVADDLRTTSRAYVQAMRDAASLGTALRALADRARAAAGLPALTGDGSDIRAAADTGAVGRLPQVLAIVAAGASSPPPPGLRAAGEAILAAVRAYRASFKPSGSRVDPAILATPGSIAAHGFLSLEPLLVGALTGTDAGNLNWLGTSTVFDYMHFELSRTARQGLLTAIPPAPPAASGVAAPTTPPTTGAPATTPSPPPAPAAPLTPAQPAAPAPAAATPATIVPALRVAGAATAAPVVGRVVTAASPLVGTANGAVFWDHIRRQFNDPVPAVPRSARNAGAALAPLVQELFAPSTVAELVALRRPDRTTALSETFTRLMPAAAPAGPDGAAPTLPEEIAAEEALISARIRTGSEGGWRAVREGVLASFGVFEVGAPGAIQRANAYYAGLVASRLFGEAGSLVHTKLQEALDRATAHMATLSPAALAEIKTSAGAPGGFRIRPNTSDPSRLSDHSFGWAVDFTPKLNPFIGRTNRVMLASVADVTGRTDPMTAETDGLTATAATAVADELRTTSRQYVAAMHDRASLGLALRSLADRARAAVNLAALTGDGSDILTAAGTGSATRRSRVLDVIAAGAPTPRPDRLTAAAGSVLAAVRAFEDSLVSATTRKPATHIATLGSVAANGFLSLDPRFVGALAGSDAGALNWLGTSDVWDYMHFELRSASRPSLVQAAARAQPTPASPPAPTLVTPPAPTPAATTPIPATPTPATPTPATPTPVTQPATPPPTPATGPDRYGGYDLQRGDRDDSARYGGRVRTTVAGDTLPAQGATGFVRQLQEDLRALGFLLVGTPDGQFGLDTELALREFQIYARMANLAQEALPGVNPLPPRYVDRLAQVVNPQPYTGPISGLGNAATRSGLQDWIANRLRCPVVIEAWNMSAGNRTTLRQGNLWGHLDETSTAPRMFARDFTGYYAPLPGGRNANDLIVLGDFATYPNHGGPRSKPPEHTWAEAEMVPEHLVGVALGALTPVQLSTFKVVRAVAEQECLGFFDSLTAYDRAIVSQGPCHWTLGLIGTNGLDEGELCGYLSYLRQVEPADFARAVESFGMRVDESWVGAAGAADGSRLFSSSSRKYAGWVAMQQEDGGFVRAAETADMGNYFRTWHWFYRFSMAGRTIPGYRRHMWDMARLRLRDIRATPWGAGPPAVPDVPIGGGATRPATIGDVFTSEQALALIMRWHVWRPADMVSGGHAGSRLRAALTGAAIPTAAGDPTTWTDAHEQALVRGLMDQVAAFNDAGLTQSMTAVRDWHTWGQGGGPRHYALDPTIPDLAATRGSLVFDAAGLPPPPP